MEGWREVRGSKRCWKFNRKTNQVPSSTSPVDAGIFELDRPWKRAVSSKALTGASIRVVVRCRSEDKHDSTIKQANSEVRFVLGWRRHPRVSPAVETIENSGDVPRQSGRDRGSLGAHLEPQASQGDWDRAGHTLTGQRPRVGGDPSLDSGMQSYK